MLLIILFLSGVCVPCLFCDYVNVCASAFGSQFYPLELELATWGVWATWGGCQEPNYSPLEEQSMLLTTEPSPAPYLIFLRFFF